MKPSPPFQPRNVRVRTRYFAKAALALFWAALAAHSLRASEPAAAEQTQSSPAKSGSNAAPAFVVRAYEIRGDTLLSNNVLTGIFAKYTGTNIGVSDILKAGSELQMEYRDRGYPTVQVVIPPQQISNGIVKIRVFEGFLSDVVVTNNHYFSSNNVLRALPSLRKDVLLVRPVFQTELDRANANQDRQIYPQIEPGPRTNTTRLVLDVKDRLPLHAKVELNNQSSPGTPELRGNGSAVYNNLWQYEHSFGVQYSFSPELWKSGDKWETYDRPLVANYSAFYRLPLGNPEAVADVVSTQPGNFGYDEASRRFRLPPPSGRAELNLYASRATIDTSLMTLSDRVIQNIPGVLSIREQDVQEDFTVNEDIGARLTIPLASTENSQSTISGGIDNKTYDFRSFKTNNFFFSIITVNPNGTTNPPVTSKVASPVPPTHHPLDYLPVSLRYDVNWHDAFGVGTFGAGIGANTWYSGTKRDFQNIAGSRESSGRWMVLSGSMSREVAVYTNWMLTAVWDGQWASEPLISTEQFGAGGVVSVRGYREGEVFGDNGWHISVEQKTPPHIVGLVSSSSAMTIRGSAYMDYAETYLLDPGPRKPRIPLWGVGFGAVANIGPHWETKFLFSWPLLTAGSTTAFQPRFNFSLMAQF